jgi:anti-sigma factor RsiW
MKCESVREKLLRYEDGDLPARQRAEIEQHLATCGACARELARLRRTVGLVESLPEAPVARDFTRRVMAAVRALPRREPTPALRWPVGLGLGSAGFVLTLTILVGALVGGPPSIKGLSEAALPLLGVLVGWGRVAADVLGVMVDAVIPALTTPVFLLVVADVGALAIIWLLRRKWVAAKAVGGLGIV